jgi:hypothetical protein
VVVASLETGDYGMVSASRVANEMRRSFQSIRFGWKFQERWTVGNKTRRYSLLIIVCSFLKWNIIASGVPRGLLIGLSFSLPFLIRRTIDYASNRL